MTLDLFPFTACTTGAVEEVDAEEEVEVEDKMECEVGEE